MTIPLHTDTAGKTCIDLAALYGARYRLGWEADGATRSHFPRGDLPWLRRVPCRFGYVYVIGGYLLAAVAAGHPSIGRRLRQLPGVIRAFGEPDETVVHFPVAVAESVLALLRPYRRRVATEAQRRALAAGRRPFPRALPVANAQSTVVGATIGTQADLTPVPAAPARPTPPEAA